jgi:hypothetical protein
MRINLAHSRSRVLIFIAALSALAILPAAASAAPKKAKIGFSAPSYTVVEGNAFNVTVVRTGNTRVAASVNYTTLDGTATAPGDYTATSGTLNFAAGETRKTVSVPTTDNTDAGAASKTLTLRLSGAVPDSVPPGKANATLRILDNDGPGTIDFSSASYSVVEGAGVATITVTRASASNLIESVDYTTTELAAGATHAVAGTDYTTTTGTLTFDVNEMSKSFQVPIADDSDAEDDETLDVTLSNPRNLSAPLGTQPVLGTNNPATLTIIDDDIAAFSFSAPTYSVDEDDPSAIKTITVNRGGAANVAADIDYSVDPDSSVTTATGGGVDYTLASGTLHFAAGETSKTFDVTITNDNTADEGNETVGLRLTDGGTVVATALLSIVDDDTSLPSVQFSNVAYSVNEAATTATVTVTLSDPAAGGETVDYATTDDTATNGATNPDGSGDYVDTHGTLAFTAGQSSQTIDIPLNPDDVIEDDESFSIALSNESGLQLGDPHDATVTILDNDGTGTLEFSALRYDVNETSGNAVVTVNRVGGSAGTASVDYSTSDGTAHAPGDYTATSGTLSFANGETQKTFAIPIAWDGLAESDETVSIGLSNFVSDDDIGVTKAAVLHIADSGASGPVQFSAGSYTVAENGGPATITVNRSGNLGGPVTVDYATSDGTAHAGTDYTSSNGTLTFGPSETSKTFQVPVTDDSVRQGGRSVNLTLSNPGGGTAVGTQGTAALTITDNEPVSSPSTDRTAPKLTVTAKKLQKALKAKRFTFKVRSNEAATLAITVKVRKSAKSKKLVSVAKASKKVVAGKTLTITVKLNKKAIAKLRKALVKGKVKIRVTVKGTDAAKNSASVTKTFTIR